MKIFVAIPLLFCSINSIAQTPVKVTPANEQQLELLAAENDNDFEDDNYLQTLTHFLKHPLNINTASKEDLLQFKMLDALQVESFFNYKMHFGSIIDLHELQAVPLWDIETIRKIVPYITLSTNPISYNKFKELFKGGDHIFLFRFAEVMQKAKGYEPPKSGSTNYYLGSRSHLFTRYRYNYRNLLQYGFSADKDAGEEFFKGTQPQGFDFYSFHFFVQKMGIVKRLAIGDFAINMGQGLIQWQSLAFKKGADVLGVKRQQQVLMPYSSAGEFYFHRGVGVTLQKNKWELTTFVSNKKISANIVSDTVHNDEWASSIQNSGYHRTLNEVADKNAITQFSFGSSIKYKASKWQVGFNQISYYFSKPLQKQAEPYNLFSIKGNSWMNISADYSGTYKNMHFFGELAMDKLHALAFTQGVLISLHNSISASFVYRNISRKYQSLYSNAFTENSLPTNEKGLYVGLSVFPIKVLRVDGYMDFFKFPWLKYRVDAPSVGYDYMVQASYNPNTSVSIYARFRNEIKQQNSSFVGNQLKPLTDIAHRSVRLQADMKLSSPTGL